MFFGSGTTRCFAFPLTFREIHNLVARLVIEVLCDSASLASIRDNNVRHKRNFMQYPTVNRDNSKQGSSKLLSVIGFCAVSLLQPVFTVSHAIDTDTPLLRHDSDGDGAPNTVDFDDDNDGIPDRLEIAADGSDIDSDSDGMPNRIDLDSDNDGILDWMESGATKTLDLSSLRKVGGRLIGEVGNNGMLDVFESPVDTGNLTYKLANTDVNHDVIPDFLDLDSDNDGWPDLKEAGVASHYDANRDARIDVGQSSVGNDGIADYLQQINDQACCDLDGDGVDDIIPVNTDRADYPDFQDLDSDNDGIPDIIELNGLDDDGNGHVDNFRDVVGGPDGMDDGVLSFPYLPVDENGNGVFDHIDTGNLGEQSSGDELARAASPLSPDQLADGSSGGAVLTGLSAVGCSIGSVGQTNANNFWLMLLLLFSIHFWASRPSRFSI